MRSEKLTPTPNSQFPIPKGGRETGLSLVEATIILSVIAILTAALAPSINGYVSDAQHAAARRDVEAIGSALSRMLSDVGETWFLRDGNGGGATSPPSHASANRVDLLVTSGATPPVTTARVSAGVDWDDPVDNAAVQRLEYFLVANTPSNTAANAYRTAASMSVAGEFDPDSGAFYNAAHAWRGAYMAGPIGPDPWGTRYAINVEFLARALGAGPSGTVNDVVVVSAGPDRVVDTPFDVDGATSGSDVLYVLSGGSQ
jgi:type II secretory pathway pseudopilin PulG